MNLKQLVGNSAFFMINKTIMKRVGIESALLLQHLIDIEDSYFKGIEFYQQVSRLKEDTGLSDHGIREAKKTLIKSGAISITKKGLPSKDHFVLHHTAIQLWFESDTSTGLNITPLEVQKLDRKDKESNKEKINKTNISDDERLLDKVIEKYPGNVGSKTPILKALKLLSTEEKKLTLINLDRYQKAWAGYHHNLRNYIEGKQFLDTELKKRETKSTPKGTTTKTFTANYDNID